jgi:hypothetical protein
VSHHVHFDLFAVCICGLSIDMHRQRVPETRDHSFRIASGPASPSLRGVEIVKGGGGGVESGRRGARDVGGDDRAAGAGLVDSEEVTR